MSLVSFEFLLFMIIVFLIYFIVPKKIRWFVLLASSMFFLLYDNISIQNIVCILLVILTSYIGGILIDKYKNTKKSKVFLILSILIILGQLIYLKYLNFFVITGNHILNLFNINYEFTEFSISSTPVGVSYYSLVMIGYLINVYWDICKPQKNILKCALFMSYFPILTSGPITKYEDTGEKLFEPHKFSYDRLCSGLTRIVWGLFKFLVISERLAIFVNTVYADPYTYQGFYIVLAALFFVLELYTNFSGSIDIIMGISEIFGIDLPENFNSPFFSKTITEFWRNWHITLGTFLKDYIFYPLQKSSVMQKLNNFVKKLFGKKFAKKFTMYLCMLIMWLIIGIWHGGSYSIIIGSGILQFIYILLEGLLSPVAEKINKKLGINTETFGYKLYQIIRTYLLFSFAMIFFAASSVSNAIEIIKNMFVYNPWILLDNSSLFTLGIDALDFNVLIVSIVVLFIVDYLHLSGSVRKRLLNQNLPFRWLLLFILIFSVIIFGCYGPGYDASIFIYEQF